MNSNIDKFKPTPDFRAKATLGVAVTALILVTPFSFNNFFQSRYILGFGSLAIIALLVVNAWNIRRGRYNPMFAFVGLAPAVIMFLALSLHKQGIIGALWCYPAILSFYIILSERQAWTANVVLLVATLPQIWMVLEQPVAIRVAITLLAVSTFSAIFIRVITSQQRKLEAQALTDPLTGLSNRVLLPTSLEQAAVQSQRTGVPMTVLSIDFDHFKAINDDLGHDAGDTVLHNFGELLRKRLRSSDKVFRLGGEEFLVLLYGTSIENGREVAEELRAVIESSQLLPGRIVTVSIGVATLQPGEIWSELMKRSDDNLYRAKANGRNRVES